MRSWTPLGKAGKIIVLSDALQSQPVTLFLVADKLGHPPKDQLENEEKGITKSIIEIKFLAFA